jgi:lipopolysaccharide transport system permease protein
MKFPKDRSRVFCQQIIHNIKVAIVLANTQFKTKNARSFLGILWYLLDPILMFLILMVVRGMIHNTSFKEYPIYLFIGLIMFNFFRKTTTQSATAITQNKSLVSLTNFNKEPLVLSQVISTTYSHFFEIVVLAFLSFIYSVNAQNLIFYIFSFIFLFIFTYGISKTLAALGTIFSDFNNVWSVILHIAWFATPIFYVLEKSSSIANKLINLNPIKYFLDLARDPIIFNLLPNNLTWIIIFSLSILSLIFGTLIFNKQKKFFAERI